MNGRHPENEGFPTATLALLTSCCRTQLLCGYFIRGKFPASARGLLLFCLLTTRCGGNKVSYGVCNHCVQAMFEAFCDSVVLCAEKKVHLLESLAYRWSVEPARTLRRRGLRTVRTALLLGTPHGDLRRAQTEDAGLR